MYLFCQQLKERWEKELFFLKNSLEIHNECWILSCKKIFKAWTTFSYMKFSVLFCMFSIFSKKVNFSLILQVIYVSYSIIFRTSFHFGFMIQCSYDKSLQTHTHLNLLIHSKDFISTLSLHKFYTQIGV